jgi:N-acetylneuraminate synthase
VITAADIWARRPGSGEISVQHFDRLIGATLTQAVQRNQQLRWSDVNVDELNG